MAQMGFGMPQLQQQQMMQQQMQQQMLQQQLQTQQQLMQQQAMPTMPPQMPVNQQQLLQQQLQQQLGQPLMQNPQFQQQLSPQQQQQQQLQQQQQQQQLQQQQLQMQLQQPSIGSMGQPMNQPNQMMPQQQLMQQRQAGAAQQATGPLQGASAYTVISQGNDHGEVVIRTLLGDYVEKGANHGRKFYQKVPKPGVSDFVEVFLYYWDNRDGPNFEGWWFGNKLGGTQVWSHCADRGLAPPAGGWKIPWDGQVRATLILGPKQNMQRQEAEGKLKAISADVSKVDAEAKQAMQQATALCGNNSSLQALQQAEQILAPHSQAMIEVQRKLAEGQRGQQGDVARNFVQLANQLRMTQQSLTQLTTKYRDAKAQAEKQVKMADAELRETKAFEDLLPETTQKCTMAEEAMEKAVATHETIAGAGADLDQAQKAVGDTEVAVKEAEKALGEARMVLQGKLNFARRFEAPKVRDNASQELNKMMAKLQTVQSKLMPLKTARHELAQRAAAQKRR
ncbi:unnamed protein product [Effrenium voratum]|nr:unnamed protein product [Effrenium voratum]